MAAPENHIHISEREVAHTWPDGQKDDAAWEDCTFCSVVMLSRVCFKPSIAATHAEAELLRDAAAEDPIGGTNTDDAIRGIETRYGWRSGWTKVQGFTSLWTELKPGMAAMVQGRTGIFPFGHRLRRWDPKFSTGHAVVVFREDNTDRVWWDDPLAPKGTYTGEWVTKEELKKYVDAFGGSHLVAQIGGIMALKTLTTTVPKLIDLVPGSELFELDGVTKIKRLENSYNNQPSPYGAGIFRYWTAVLGGKRRPVLVRYYRNLREVPTVTSGITQAQVDAARTAGVISGKQEGLTQGVTEEKSRLRKLLGL